MDVGFVDYDYRVIRFVSNEVLDIGSWSEGTSGVIGIADVKESGIRAGGEHRFDVMGTGLCKRDPDHARAVILGGHHAEFESGIASHIAFLRIAESHHTERQGR